VNPFDDDDASFLVLINEEGQHSLWPAHLGAPDGWRTVYGPAARSACLGYVDDHWSDMRPLSLIARMDQAR
jgi:MbtH protein